MKREWSWKWGGLPVKDEWDEDHAKIEMHESKKVDESLSRTQKTSDLAIDQVESYDTAKDLPDMDIQNRPLISNPLIPLDAAVSFKDNPENIPDTPLTSIEEPPNTSDFQSKELIAMSLCGLKELKPDKHKVSIYDF
jgi:hypothetical protein